MEFPTKIAMMLESAGICNTTCNDRLEYERQKADCLNEQPGNLLGCDCQKCLNRGYIHYVKENGEMATLECECMIQRRNIWRIERSGLKDAITRYTFDTWQATERWQRDAKDTAERYAKERKGWFVAAGQVGSGKTHLCTAICAELMNAGINTRYMLWRDVAVQAKANVNDDEVYADIVGPLKRVKCLYIDDLFKVGKGKPPTDGDVNLAFEILNSRYNDSSKLTIISTERTMEELLDIDEAVGSRIYERSAGYRLDFTGKTNWRLRNGNR